MGGKILLTILETEGKYTPAIPLQSLRQFFGPRGQQPVCKVLMRLHLFCVIIVSTFAKAEEIAEICFAYYPLVLLLVSNLIKVGMA